MYAARPPDLPHLLRCFIVVATLLCGVVKEGVGQRVYATSVSTGGSGVTNASNATSVDGTTEPTATPRARISRGGLSSSGTAYLQLQFGSTIPQNASVLVRVDNELVGLLNGSISISAYESGSLRSSSSSKFTMSNGLSFYSVNVTGGNFNQIRITANASTLGTAEIDVFYALYEPPSTNCATALGTSENITGLLPLSAGIDNINHAIDGDLSTNSRLYVGLGLGTTVTQTVYFSNLSNPGDAATVTLSANPSLLSVGLLGSTQIDLYKGSQHIDGISISSLLQGTDLLGLLQSAEKATLSFVPDGNQVFDRIVVSMSSLVGVAASLNLWEVARTPAKPTVPIAYPNVIEICDGETVSITAESPSAGSILRWYNAVNDGTLLQESTGNPDTYITPPLPYTAPDDTTFIYVAAAWDSGCPAESERTKIAIVIHPKPTVAPISGEDDVCVNDQIALSSGTVGGTWSSDDNDIASVNPSSGVVSGIATGTVTIRYTVSDSETSCSNYQEKEITVHPKPNTPSIVTH